MAQLCVNIDHVATVRQARRTYEPDPALGSRRSTTGRSGRHYRPSARRPPAYPGPRRPTAQKHLPRQTKPRNGRDRRDGRHRLLRSNPISPCSCPKAEKRSPPKAGWTCSRSIAAAQRYRRPPNRRGLNHQRVY